MPAKKPAPPASGYIVTAVGRDTVRVDVFDDSKPPPGFHALVMSSESALTMSKMIGQAALQTMPPGRKK
jgi:hypothetical protein